MRVSVIGLGKLGAPACAVLADIGHTIIGHDVDADVVTKMARGEAPVEEPGLQALLLKHRDRITAMNDLVWAVRESDITLIIVPTPSLASGSFDVNIVRKTILKVAIGLREKHDYHVVTVVSTVMPGNMAYLTALLEAESGMTCGTDFGVCYNPEFIALGSVINNMKHPDFILIGESDMRAGDVLERMYIKVSAPVVRMSFVNAEITKIALNSYVTMKISFANQLANMCQETIGGDAQVVTQALGLDSRIGRKYLKGALGFGGPCFPRDNRAFQVASERVGYSAPLAVASDDVNARQLEMLLKTVSVHSKTGDTIGILGLTYKPNTPVTEESQAMQFANRLAREMKLAVRVFDPAVPNPRELPMSVHACASVLECVTPADIVVLATPWEDFRILGPLHLKHPNVPVIDCWNFLSNDFPNRIVLGRGPKS